MSDTPNSTAVPPPLTVAASLVAVEAIVLVALAVGELADLDADGIPALIEHFLGTRDDATTTPQIVPSRLPDGRLAITFPRRLGADDLRYTVEASTGLVNWTAPVSRLQHTQQPNGIVRETWSANVPAPTPAYLRLRVMHP